MVAIRLRLAASLLLFAGAGSLLAWSLWPFPQAASRLTLSAVELAPDGTASGGQAVDGSPLDGPPVLEDGGRDVVLEWPSVVRTGQASRVRLALLPIDEGQPPEKNAQAVTILVEARLELPGIDHNPPDRTTQVLLSGRPVYFYWDLNPAGSGDFSGTVWLHVRSAPADGKARLISAQRLRLQAQSFLGMNAAWARALGGAGTLLGAAFSLEGLAAWRRQRTKLTAV